MVWNWPSLFPLALVLCFVLIARSRHAAAAVGPLRLVSSHWSVLIFAVIVAVGYRILRRSWEPFALAAGAISLLPSGAESDRKTLVERVLDGPGAPVVIGICTAALTIWSWGSWPPTATYHDEMAYRLQAGIFASGRWADPSPTLSEFFEQMHVLVLPARAAKYYPGHAFLLTPGVWVGHPAGGPILLSVLCGALVFALARGLTNSYVGLLTWVIWVAAPGGLKYRASFFSEVTTGFLWLAAWWALQRWRESGRRAWLLSTAACIGWGLITRPLTMLVFAVPVGIVVLRLTYQRARWRDLRMALLLGAMVLLLIPLWSFKTTGDWKTTPLTLYTRTYLPFDRPGFGADTSPPLRELPSDIHGIYQMFLELHQEHTLASVGKTLRERGWAIREDFWGGWRRPLALFALVGLFFLPIEAAFGAAVSILLVLAYLTYAHSTNWALYYIEMHPVLAFLTAVGIWQMLLALTVTKQLSRKAGRPGLATCFLALLTALALMGLSYSDLESARSAKQDYSSPQTQFRLLVGSIPYPAIVFVTYSPYHDIHRSLIWNEPDLPHARVWLVYDRGVENEKLMRLAPNRHAYLYDEANGALTPIPAGPSVARL